MTRPEPLQPAFDFSAAPEPASLFHGSAELHLGDDRHTGIGEVLLRFQPDPRIVINAKFQGSQETVLSLAFSNSNDPSFFLNNQQIKGVLTKVSTIAEDMIGLDWIPEIHPFVMGDMKAKTSVTMVTHLFNFPDFRSGQHQVNVVPAGCHLLILDCEEWQILLQSLANNATHAAWERLKQEGGCFLTHVAQLKRKDGKPFSGEEAEEPLLILANFLSFVKGSRFSTVCEVGLDATGAKTYENFASPRTNGPMRSWFEERKGHQAEILFPLFVKRWQQSKEWRDCLVHAIYWYTQANTDGSHPGIDSAIILAQTALERLAYHHLVVDRKMISSEGFKKLVASDRLRMLLSSLNIPIGITGATPDIQHVAKWIDGPHAMTDIRNSLVHPDNKKDVGNCYFDAWKLSIWYLELSILALCQYNDTYKNFLRMGQIDYVPWKNKI